MHSTATLTTDYGECTTCGSNTTPAFLFPALDKSTMKQKRVCGVCLASMSLHVGFVPVEKYDELHTHLAEKSTALKRADESLDIARTQLLETTSRLERAEAELDSARSQLSSTTAALKIDQVRANEAERGVVGIEAYRRLFAEAQDAKPKATTRKREVASV